MTKQPSDLDPDEHDALTGLAAQLDVIRARHRGNPPLDLLRAAQHDVLPGGLQEEVSEHLRGNAWSRALVEGLDGGTEVIDPEAEARLLKRITRASRPTATAGRPWLRLTLAGCGIAVATLAVMLRPLPTPAPNRATPPPASTATAAPPTAAAPLTPPVPPSVAVAFEKAEVRVSLALMTWRGTSVDSNPMLTAFKPAFDAYRAGDYPRAAAAFAGLARVYPEAVEPPFYQGVSLMLAGDFTGAVAPLASALRTSDDTFAIEAGWYLSVAELRLGRTGTASARIRGLCATRQHGPACAALASLPPLPAR